MFLSGADHKLIADFCVVHALANGNGARATQYAPKLLTVRVGLQTKRFAGVHGDDFDGRSFVECKALVISPRTNVLLVVREVCHASIVVQKKSYTVIMSTQKRVVAVSGGFDPLHIGHVRYFEEAKKLGDELVVILNNDNWLVNKKGYAFMPEQERKEVIEALRVVDRVIVTDHEVGESDRSVCRALESLRPHVFANGGDRKPDGDPVPEVMLCDSLGIEMIYNVGHGGKVQSSSWLTGKVKTEADGDSK
jgi:cytidyltransferase-like protein